uniref:MATH domain-containing protein n=1 Tax=Strigamia maritima TaxID=126957 RepID=T1IZ86_STRMM
MALLYRLVKLRDAGDTRVFTFIVTRTVTRDVHRNDVTSKEFPCACHKWAISFTRTDRQALGVFLVWRSACVGIRCYVDFVFTLLNREHFGQNEVFSAKCCRFTVDQLANGNRRLIPSIDELRSRAFTDDNGEFQVEVALANITTVFESDIRVPHPLCFSHGKSAAKLETNYFLFGNFEWNVAVVPLHDAPDKILITLNRLTGFDYQCRVRYRVVLGDGDRRLDSSPINDFSDSDGRGFGWPVKAQLSDFVRRGSLRIYIELISAHTISEVKVFPSNGISTCYDREKQTWAIEADANGDFLRLKVVYKDAISLARNHLRYVAWSAQIVRRHPKTGTRDLTEVLKTPLSHYYIHEADDGIMMETNIPIHEVISDPACFFLDDSNHLIVHIEWIESVILFQASYHKYDEICRAQNYQMRKEINSLQTENQRLERQLLRCRKSLAYFTSRFGRGSEELPPSPEACPAAQQLSASDTD